MPARSKPTPFKRQRLLFRIAYLGDAHTGWQSQPSGEGVQDQLERALKAIYHRELRIHGAGRTDAGVHASGQMAHVDLPLGGLSPEKWPAAMNGNLPRSIRVLDCRVVPTTFHARFSAKGKTYRYRVWLDRWHHPLEIGRSWHFPAAIERDRLPTLLASLRGTHDFAAFTANRRVPPTSTIRTLYRVTARRSGRLFELRFTGSGFLFRMVRMLVGGILDCLRTDRDADRLARQLEDPSLRLMREAAPAHGLILERVHYRALHLPSE